MIGIKEFAFELGSDMRTVEDIASICPAGEAEQMRSIGLERIPADNERMLWDMIEAAYQRIETKPDCILIAHSLPFIRTNGDNHELDPSIPTYFLSGLPCVIMHRAVEIGARLIRRGMWQNVLVIGADKAYSDQERVFFHTIMGDGVVALLLSEQAEGNLILSSWISTTIFAPEGENSDPEDIADFRQRNPAMMRAAIEKCLSQAGLAEVDYFVTHTSNRKFWDGLSALCHVPREKFFDGNICNTGHMNSHDSFYHYFYWCQQGVIRPGDRVMLINPGFGGSQGCTLIQR